MGGVTELQFAPNETYVTDAVNASAENDGCHVVLGTLDSERKVINVVASNGVLVASNIGEQRE